MTLRLGAERSAHLQMREPGKLGPELQHTHGARRDLTKRLSNKGDLHNYLRRFANLSSFWFLVQAALARSLATMRTDFALVLTAALLFDTFGVSFRFCLITSYSV